MKRLTKIFTIICFTLILCFSVSIVHAESVRFYSIKASVGENATSVGINYHTNTEESKLYLANNKEMKNAIEYTPSQILWGKGTTNGEDKTVFAERYVCSVNITDLTLDTDYYYQIKAGSSKSNVNHFKTAKSTKTTFAVFCDTQASGINFNYSDQLAKKLTSINSDINFFIIAGDIVDRGGYEEQWNYFDTYMPYVNGEYLQATIPGNHELYHSSLGSYIDESIYNKYYNNPKNGSEKRLNSTYYFKYNNTLFIMLDTMQRSNSQNLYDEQIAWFKSVVMNNPSDFIIVVTHPGCYSAGAYTSDAEIMRGRWRNVFEQCGVDLAISGHEHVYLRTKSLYQDKVDEDRGITYVIGGCAGAKRYTGTNNPELFEVYLESNNPLGTYTGSIIEIIDNQLVMSYYNSDGELLDQFSLTSKKQVNENYTIDEFLDSFSVYFNDKTRRNILTWDRQGYGIVKDIDVYITHLDVTVNSYVGPTSNELAIGMGIPNKDYQYIVTVHDYEGNSYTKTVDVINDQEALRPSDFVLDIKETEKYQYDLVLTYNPKGFPTVSYELIYDGESHEIKWNEASLTLDKKIDLSKIQINYCYVFYGEAAMAEISLANNNLTINADLIEEKVESNNCQFGAYSLALASLISLTGLLYLIKKRH